MEHGNNFMNVLSNNIDPPFGVPLVEICDQKRVLIENHQGIALYTCEEIRVKVNYGCITVCGERLKLAKMSREKLVITGKIGSVNLHGRR